MQLDFLIPLHNTLKTVYRNRNGNDPCINMLPKNNYKNKQLYNSMSETTSNASRNNSESSYEKLETGIKY